MAKRQSAIEEELQQRRPFRSTGIAAVVSVMRTAALLQRHLSQAVEPSGITRQQYNVLRILRGAGDKGLPTLAIRDRRVEEAPGITRLIDRLEHAGLVTRERCSPDRRQVLCHITASGLALLERLEPRVDAAVDEVTDRLSEQQRQELVLLLDSLRERLR